MSQEAFPLADVDVVVRGDISPEIVDYTRDKVVRTTRFADRPVLMARVVLTVDPDPAHDRPAQAEATIDVSGVPVRAKVAATTPTEAADFLQDRLRRRLDQLSKRRSDRHRWVTEVLAAAQVGNQRPRYADRPAEEREVVRRKTFAVAPLTPDEAAYEMDLLEHDFYLFVDANTSQDALIHRRPDGAFGLAEVGHALVPPPEPSRMVLEPAPPRLSEADAIARLDAAGEPFVFHVDPQTGRGRVLYRRFDGNYGVIVIAEH
ncbi:MAG TPA: HPF/RaiA family ribosome-associated protein [Actinomycetes bacterium]|nr:HPF/RaiA family ribosome-associated protein [Actinomycetes bacterium]